MSRRIRAAAVGLLAVLLAAVLAYWLILPGLAPAGPALDFAGIKGDPVRGAYILGAAGCVACHTDSKAGKGTLAGGPPLKTPFGTFYAPNITPHPESGIGGWTLAQFARALTVGMTPTGEHYFPSFPYTSYAGMTANDIADLKSYLDTIKPIDARNHPHSLHWPFSDRRLLAGWKWLFFDPKPHAPDLKSSKIRRRGAYLVSVLGHCGECHTQRNLLGGRGLPALAGNARGPDGEAVPGIAGITTRTENPWSKDDITTALQLGMTPSGDFLGASMAEVIQHATSKLTSDDVAAIADYLAWLKTPK